jgi:D-alanine-D-alanine ligase
MSFLDLNSHKNKSMKTVGIFCGGFSSEWEISMKSAQTIEQHFPEGYQPIRIQVSKGGWEAILPEKRVPFDLNTMNIQDEIKTRIDVGLVYIHGDPGENGKIQALLEMHNIPYVNSGPLPSALSFDKWYCNQFLNGFGIPVAKSIFTTHIDQFSAEEIVSQLGLPLFVKPSDSGSSFGISKVKTADGIHGALEQAFQEGRSVVIESFLDGTEVTCGVYRTKTGMTALPLTEIASENEFFDYNAKYLGQSQEITPARISPEMTTRVQETAKKVYSLLNLRSIARIDFMVVNDVPHVIEVNTTPGFSPASIVPQMIDCAGQTITNFWTEIFEAELQGNQ